MSILLIDDHPMFVEGIGLILRQAMREIAVHAVSTGKDAMVALGAHMDIELVMTDFHLRDTAGSELLRQLTRLRRGLRILVVSASEDPADIRGALDAGAHGFISKTADSRTLLQALARVRAGFDYVPENYIASSAGNASETALPATLTPRQGDVLRLLCEGLRNGDISRRLGMSEKTVKTHVSAILAAFNVSSRTQAVLIARRGLPLGRPIVMSRSST